MLISREQIENILKNTMLNKPNWKDGKDIQHLDKRKMQNHIPSEWELEEYNQFIVDMIKNPTNEIYYYHKSTFIQSYIVIGDGKWISLIGENGVMETAFRVRHYSSYLSEKDGFTFLGPIKEVCPNVI